MKQYFYYHMIHPQNKQACNNMLSFGMIHCIWNSAAIPPSFVRTAIAILRAEGPAAFALGLSAAVPRVIVGRYLRFALARVLLARCANVRLARVHCMRLFVGVGNDTAAPHNWLRTMR